MTKRQKASLKRAARTLAAAVIAWAIAYIAGPDGVELLGDHQALTVAVLTPLLTAADKALRWETERS